MASKTILYEWLEKWEQALEGPELVDLDTFVQNNCQEGDRSLLVEFRRRANVLRSINADLRAFGALADTGPDALESTDRKPPARPTLEPGQEVIPGYALERCLGQGGFGTVWQARSPSGGSVAMKLVRLGEQVAQIEQRALDVMGQVRHPHLLPVLASWRTAGFLVIAMELADGTLADRLSKAQADGQTGIPREELLRYFEQAADALDHLNRPYHGLDGHEHPAIQHRDIKPQNLLLVGGDLKIGDFGLARCLENSVTSHTGCHTPAYAAPEFFDGKATSQSDQYSLAVTWCVLRGGRLPFEGSYAQIMAGHLQGNPDVSMLPEAERYPVLRALSKGPKQRWPDSRSFVAALRKGFDAHVVRQALLDDPNDELLRQVYLSLRTPELRERDRRGVRVRPWVFPFVTTATVFLVVTLPFFAFKTLEEFSLKVMAAIIIGLSITVTISVAYLCVGLRKVYGFAVAHIEQFGPRRGVIANSQSALPFSAMYWNDATEDDVETLDLKAANWLLGRK